MKPILLFLMMTVPLLCSLWQKMVAPNYTIESIVVFLLIALVVVLWGVFFTVLVSVSEDIK